MNIFFVGYYSHPDKQFHYNMISVHWTPLATWDNYFVAASNAVKVGQHSGQVIGLDLLSNYFHKQLVSDRVLPRFILIFSSLSLIIISKWNWAKP